MSTSEVSLRDMRQDEFDVFWARQEHEYVASLTAVLPVDAARTKARQDRERLLPDGLGTADHRLLCVEDEQGAVVGWVWLALREPRTGTTDVAWLYEIEIAATARGRGYGRAALTATEAIARAAGATQLQLNVFAHNTTAVRLYERSGYAVTTQQMTKRLT